MKEYSVAATTPAPRPPFTPLKHGESIVICPNCKQRFSSVCGNCGYDPATGRAKLSREDLGLVDPQGPQADIWIGYFPSEVAYEEYFAELEEYEEGTPISRFAKEQGIVFYDHDFFATWFGSNDIEAICREVFAETMDLSKILEAVSRSVHGPFNVVAMQLDELGDEHRACAAGGEQYWLAYLGRFEYEPRD